MKTECIILLLLTNINMTDKPKGPTEKKRVVLVDFDTNTIIKTFDSMKACAADFAITASVISDDIKFSRVRDNMRIVYNCDAVVGDILKTIVQSDEWPVLPCGVQYTGRTPRPVKVIIKYRKADYDLGKYNDVDEASQVYNMASKLAKETRGGRKIDPVTNQPIRIADADLSIQNIIKLLANYNGVIIKSRVK